MLEKEFKLGNLCMRMKFIYRVKIYTHMCM